MIFEFKIDSENAAFSEMPECEIARLLRQTADRIENGSEDGTLTEFNGNKCGNWYLEVPDNDT